MSVYVSESARKRLPPGAVVIEVEQSKDELRCRYVDSKFRECHAPAVYDVGLTGRGVLQRCEKHKRASARGRRQNIRRFMFRRALQRGLLSQLEMLEHLETRLESGLRGWEWSTEHGDGDEEMARLFAGDWLE